MKLITCHRIGRFVLVGLLNTVSNFALINLAFFVFHFSKIGSSIASSIIIITISFILNRNFVFEDTSKKVRHQIPPFVLITVTGSIIVFNLVYIISLKVISGHEYFIVKLVEQLTSLKLSNNFVDINLSTSFVTLVAMFWNYNGYRLFVFKGRKISPERLQNEE